MIRPARPDDTDALMAIADASGLFQPHELDEVGGMLAAHFSGDLGPDHHWLTDDEDGPAAVAYYAPEPFTDGVWNLYMLAVHPDRQGDGRGAALVRHVEATLGAQGARLLLIETSGLAGFERTRSFYQKCGYVEEARIRDYYRAGDDKVVYRKSLTP
ncbi:MAG: GNAT family N-acetyltransferase [Rhodothermales bacterium]